MHTASSTVCQERWQVCFLLPSGVEQSSFSIGFDLILNSLGSREISDLCLQELGEPPELLWLPASRHWLTAFSNRGLPLRIAGDPRSHLPTLVGAPRLSLVPQVSFWPRPIRSAEYVSVVPFSCGCTEWAGTACPVGP
jgi:hypothetical protein